MRSCYGIENLATITPNAIKGEQKQDIQHSSITVTERGEGLSVDLRIEIARPVRARTESKIGRQTWRSRR